MARGDSNLLFNPPRLSKKEASSGARYLGHQVSRLFLMPKATVTEDDEGDIFLLDQQMKHNAAKIGFPRIHEGGLLVANRAGLAFGDHEGFLLYHSENFEQFFKDKLPGKLLGLHLTGSTLSCLYQDEDGSFILAASEGTKNRSWSEVTRFEGEVSFANCGENSLISWPANSTDKLKALTLGSAGKSSLIEVGADPFATIPDPHLIAPAGGGDLFALERGSHGDELTLIYKKNDEEPVSRSRIVSFIGMGLDNNWKGIASHRGKGALLGEDKIILFSTDGPGSRQDIPLDPKNRGFDQIEINSDRLLLWKRDSSAYLEIPLPR